MLSRQLRLFAQFGALLIMILSCTSLARSGCPSVVVLVSESVEFCEHCREHSLDGWILKIKIWNASDKLISTAGFWLADRDGKPFTDAKYFYLTMFQQRKIAGSQRWAADSKGEFPDWVKRGAYMRDDRLVIRPGESPGWQPIIGWDFEIEQVARLTVFAGYEGQKNLCMFSTRPFVIRRHKDSDFGTLTFVDLPN